MQPSKPSEDDLIDANFLQSLQPISTQKISNFSEQNITREARQFNVSSSKNLPNMMHHDNSQESSIRWNNSSRNVANYNDSNQRSSPIIKRKISDLSPLAETIEAEVSEDILAGGTLMTDNISDNSFLSRSDQRNVSQYMKSDVSLSHSVIEIEYEQNQDATPKDLNKPILDTSQDDQSAQTTRIVKQRRPIFRPRPIFTQTKSQEDCRINAMESALIRSKENFQTTIKDEEMKKSVPLQTNNNDDTISNKSMMQREVNISQSVIQKKENGKKKINQYIVMKNLGQGSFGKVKLVLDTNNNNLPCAMKVLSKRKLNKIFVGKNRTAMNDVQQEIAIMKKLDHINIVKLFEVLDDPSVDKLYIVMEYVKNGSLMSKLGKSKTIQPQHLWKYFRDLLAGLHYLHECAGIIHRDLKPENMLIDEVDRIKISDFGVSFIVENGCDEIQSTAGSNYFFAPEICQGDSYKGNKSDIWAIGVTLYFMMFRKYPFNASNIPALYNKILNNDPDYPSDANMLLVDLLKKIFIKDSNARISLQEIIQHDWVTSNGIQPLQIHLYPQITLNPSDATLAIQRVILVAKIRLRIKAKVKELKEKRKSNNIGTINHQNRDSLL